jgi:hypothetical protein
MSKGSKHLGTANKHSHYQFKKRCEILGCKKRAKYMIEGKCLCKIHSR